MRLSSAVLAVLLLFLATSVSARSLDEIKASGTLAVCAHPNALPFSAKDGKIHGFQLDMAEALAHRLGVSLTREWIISRYDLYRAPCDIVMDSIADPEAQEDSGLKLSKPYRRSGVALVLRGNGRGARSIADLRGRRVGVLTSSIAAMTLNQRGVDTLPANFEDELLTYLVKGEVDAAAVTPTSAGYYNLRHPGAKLKVVYLFDNTPDLSWNVAVGLRRPDDAFRSAVDGALDRMLADGTVKRIFARYGVVLQPPR
ncbi:MAG TPA: transporter substrate-binding domain-containing protein [Stellaceae bacterium]|nr:transporter substrate-binding domain-containing protein [Stellaceae bacterium]